MRVRLAGWNGAVFTLASWLFVAGCGKNAERETQSQSGSSSAKSSAIEVQSPPQQTATKPTAPPLFKDAVLFEPPEGEQRPPDKTFAGKNVGALFEEIAGHEGAPGSWDNVPL